MTDKMFEQFSREYSFMIDDVVRYYQDQFPNCLVIEMSDNRVMLYDYILNTLRRLPKSRCDMTRDECNDEFGKRLKQLLMYRGLNQEDLSQMTGIAQPAISSYIRGKTTPSFYIADKIAKALGVSLDYFRYL